MAGEPAEALPEPPRDGPQTAIATTMNTAAASAISISRALATRSSETSISCVVRPGTVMGHLANLRVAGIGNGSISMYGFSLAGAA